MLRTYALAPATLRRFLRRTIWRFQIISTLSFLVFGFYLALFSHPINWYTAGPILGIIALAYFFIIFFNYREQLRILYSLRYELDGSSILYRQVGKEPQRIMRPDITRVYERRDGLYVETGDARIFLLIPYGLARIGDADFYQTLQAWVGIQKRHSQSLGSNTWILVVGITAALLILLFANSIVVIVPLVLGLFAYGLFTERHLGRGAAYVPGIVRMYNMAFSFLIFVIVMKSCLIGLSMAMAK